MDTVVAAQHGGAREGAHFARDPVSLVRAQNHGIKTLVAEALLKEVGVLQLFVLQDEDRSHEGGPGLARAVLR